MSEITREAIEQASGDELNRLVERLVFGKCSQPITSFTECDVRKAVGAWWIDEGMAIADLESFAGPRPEGCERNVFLRVWQNRYGKDWQHGIESSVAGFVDPVRDFIGDGNRERELVAEIVRRGWVMSSCSPGLHISRWECFLQAGLGSCIVSKTGSTQAEALCRAACLACLEEAT